MAEDNRWWPIQKAPDAVAVTTDHTAFEQDEAKHANGQRGTLHTMVQSVAGLAAKAVHEGRCDEMVWITFNSKDYKQWYKGIMKRLQLTQHGPFDPWQLVKRFQEKGIIEGYILYRYDNSEGGLYERRENIDHSANVATVLAGQMKGILVDEALEDKAKELGLKMRFDARGKDMTWCFNRYRSKLNRKILLTIDPKVPHNRAMAITHQCMVVYDTVDPVPQILEWMQPGSPIMGWNCGGESEHTEPLSDWGHFQTASNWALNLPILMAGTECYQPKKIKAINPKALDFDAGRHFSSFLLSDGDNVQWLMGNFCFHPRYWAADIHGDFPIGWTSCVTQLTQVCPEVVDYLAQTKPSQTSLVEHGGGYYYPDTFAKNRTDREACLRKHAQQISAQFAKSGMTVLSMINRYDLLGDGAKAAYAIFAEEIDGLVGMISMQYYPYDAGDGEILWFKNKQGIDIPVVTVKFSIWSHARWPGGGTPAKVARMINEYAQAQEKEGNKSFSSTAVHAWSRFQKASGTDEMAENIGADGIEYRKTTHGVNGIQPIHWAVERLDKQVNVVSPEELLWRIRMEYRPQQTREVLSKMK